MTFRGQSDHAYRRTQNATKAREKIAVSATGNTFRHAIGIGNCDVESEKESGNELIKFDFPLFD